MQLNLLTTDIKMYRFAHLYFDIPADEFLKEFDFGDSCSVSFNGFAFDDVPVFGSYEDMMPGETAIYLTSGDPDISICINYGKIGVETGILKTASSDSGHPYELREDVQLPITASFELKEKGKYKNRIALSKLRMGHSKGEYSGVISDEKFANFRAINTTGLKHNILYRSASPIDPKSGRNLVADRLMQSAGIRTVIDLSDSRDKAESYEGYKDTYYSKQDVSFIPMPVAYKEKEFETALAESLRFILNNEGPYLVHCYIGKDRTGFVAALLELLTGADIDEMQNEFLQTYRSLYSPLKDKGEQLDEEIIELIKHEICKILMFTLDLESEEQLAETENIEKYLKKTGLSDKEIYQLKAKLAV